MKNTPAPAKRSALPIKYLNPLYNTRFIWLSISVVLTIILFLDLFSFPTMPLAFIIFFISTGLFSYTTRSYKANALLNWAESIGAVMLKPGNQELATIINYQPFSNITRGNGPLDSLTINNIVKIGSVTSYGTVTISITGTFKEQNFTAFEFKYTEKSAHTGISDKSESSTRTESTQYYNAILLSIPLLADQSQVILSTDDPVSKLTGKDIELESTEFNKAYSLQSNNPRLAVNLLNPELINFLNNYKTEKGYLYQTAIWEEDHFAILQNKPLSVKLLEDKLELGINILKHFPNHLK